MIKEYDFDAIVDRRGTNSVKWAPDAIRSICGNPDAEPFWVADMDLASPVEIRKALEEVVALGAYGYPKFTDNEEIFAQWAKRRHDWDVDPKQVTICQGMLGSIAMLTELMTGENDGVIVPLPAYQPFLRLVKNYRRKLVPWHLRYDPESASFSADLKEFERLCSDPSNTLLVFCSPHNPSGIVWSKEVLTQIAEIAAKNNVVVISDEIHSDLAFFEETHVPFNSVAKQAGCKAVTCMAPSKTFNIAGEHFSVTVFDDPSLQAAFKKRQAQLFATEPALLSGTAARAGYLHGFDWLTQLRCHLQENVRFMDAYCKERIPEIKVVVPHASFICFLDCEQILPMAQADVDRNPGLYDPAISPAGGVLSRFFGIRAGIAVNDGTWFGGDDFRQFVRFNYGTSRAAVEHALKNIEHAVAAMR